MRLADSSEMESLKDFANSIRGPVNGTNGPTSGSSTIVGPSKVGLTSPLVDEHAAPLKIIIVGAGIGGLSAALGLRRNGHQVEVGVFHSILLFTLFVLRGQQGERKIMIALLYIPTDIPLSFMSNPVSPMKRVQQSTCNPTAMAYCGDGAYSLKNSAQ